MGGTSLMPGHIRLAGASVRELPGFEEGAWWVQDITASLPARLIGTVQGNKGQGSALDLCSAPGGKTMQLASAGWTVTSVDSSESRLARLRENLARTHLDATVIAADLLKWSPDAPADAGLYAQPEKFVPTETTIAPNGDIFIADGYGEQYILHYNSKGQLLNYFGGRGNGDEHLDNAHGILFDPRSKDNSLLVTDRTRNCFKRFTREGKLMEIIHLPGACVCRPVVQGEYLYAAVLRSPDMNKEGSGFVTILDKHNKVVSNIGGSEPTYVNGQLQPMSQTDKIFVHPHDVCVDRDHNLYVAQWASGKVYPYKLKRV